MNLTSSNGEARNGESRKLVAEIDNVNRRWESASDDERAEQLGRLIKLSRLPDAGEAMEEAAAATSIASQPQVSIIVAARNYGCFLADCLNSCLGQTIQPLEVIYSDDASEDDSPEVARTIKGVNVLAARRHGGAVIARNRGARAARGDVLIFVDGDDQLPSNHLEQKLAALTRKHSFAYGDVQAFGGANWLNKNPPWKSRAVLWQQNICETAAAVWADYFWRAGGWREAPGNCWDWDLWLRLSQIADPVHSGSTLLYRVHPGQDSQTLGFGGPGKKIEQIRTDLHRQALQGPQPSKRPNEPLRVGFVYRTLCMGGAEQWLIDLLKAGSSRDDIAWSGVALTCPTMIDERRAAEAGRYAMLVSEGRAKSQEVGKLASITEAVKLVAAESDVLVCWSQELPPEALEGFAGPIVLLSHSSIPWEKKTIDAQRGRATHFAAVSEAAAAPFGDESERGKVAILHNGIDLVRLKTVQGRAKMRRAWGLKAAEIAIGYVGRQSWEKNPLAVAQAAAALGKPYRAVFVGDGWKECEVQYIAKHICPDAIFAGQIEPIGDALAALDCLLLASPQEGMSMAMLEAWAAGVPVVSTPVGAVPELEREHGRLTVVIDVGASPGELAAAVKAALSSKNRRVAERAKAIAREYYSAEAMAERWAGYLTGIARVN